MPGLVVDEPFSERAARMELSLRRRRADGAVRSSS
jgi:hypothetical protein